MEDLYSRYASALISIAEDENKIEQYKDAMTSIFMLFNEDENTSTITSGSELDLDDFGDDKFQCTCPKCGFRFNPKE